MNFLLLLKPKFLIISYSLFAFQEEEAATAAVASVEEFAQRDIIGLLN